MRGENAWEKSQNLITAICKKPLFLGRSLKTQEIRNQLFNSLLRLKIQPIQAELRHDCCEQDLNILSMLAKENNCDGIIAAGGGKVLDAGKLLSHRLSIPCITVPLSAATCAGWTALSNIYSPNGAFIKDQVLDSAPELLVFDYALVRQAPQKTLASGMADALAKWYEASLSTKNTTDGLVQQAVQMARVLRDQILIDGLRAYQDPKSQEWIRVAEGAALTAGLISGLGGSECRTAAAHAIHNGLTQIGSSNKSLHGEIVGFGILAQLFLEEKLLENQLAKQARNQLLPLFKKLGLTSSLEELGFLRENQSDLEKVCEFTLLNSPEILNLPFTVPTDLLLESIRRSYSSEATYSNQKNPYKSGRVD